MLTPNNSSSTCSSLPNLSTSRRFFFLVVLPLGVWFGLSTYAYDRIYLAGRENSYCWAAGLYSENYEQFEDCYECIGRNNTSVDLSSFRVPQNRIENVEFMPRDDDLWSMTNMPSLKGWIFNYDNFTDAPTVIIVHGIRSCRKGCSAMLTAGILFHKGYNILALDLRNHGASPQYTPAYASFGNSEYRDVLGAVDYLYDTYGEKALRHLGLLGISMGGAVSLVAYEKEHRFKALFLDSPACDVYGTLHFGVSRVMGSQLAPAVLYGGCLLKGGDQCAPFPHDPLVAAQKIGHDRPVHFDHCTSDTIVPVSSTYKCHRAMKQAGHTKLSKFVAHTVHKSDTCSDHLVLMLSDTEGYQNRLTDFFGMYLR